MGGGHVLARRCCARRAIEGAGAAARECPASPSHALRPLHLPAALLEARVCMRGPVWAREKHPRNKVRERPLDVIVRVIIDGQDMSPGSGDDSGDVDVLAAGGGSMLPVARQSYVVSCVSDVCLRD